MEKKGAATEGERTRIFKVRMFGGPSDDLTALFDFPTKQLTEDPFSELGGYGTKIRKPPYSLEQLVLLAETNPVHAAALEQKAMDIVGAGPKFVPLTDEEDDVQKAAIEKWLDDLTDQQTIIELLQAVVLDSETTGWGMFEVAREPGGKVGKIYHVPAHTIRAHADKLRLIQIRDSRHAWFKKWGMDLETTPLLLANGRRAPEGTNPEKLANEMLVFAKPSRRSSWYGIPNYISAIGWITLSTAARDYNIKFFSNAREPRYIITVSGLAEEEVDSTMDELEEALKTSHKDPHRNLLIPLVGDKAAVHIERMTAVQNDLHFTRLLDVTDRNILVGHRMPPDRLGTVMRGFLGGNVSASVNRIYKDAVVAPSQTVLADRFNRFVRTEYARFAGIDESKVLWEITFEDLDISDETMDIDNALNQAKSNVITLNEARAKLGYDARDDMNCTLAEFLQAHGAGGGAAAMMASAEVERLLVSQQRMNDAVLERLTEIDRVMEDAAFDAEAEDSILEDPISRSGKTEGV